MQAEMRGQPFRLRAKALGRWGLGCARVVEALGAVALACRSPDRGGRGIAALADRFLDRLKDEAVPHARLCVEAVGRSLALVVADASSPPAPLEQRGAADVPSEPETQRSPIGPARVRERRFPVELAPSYEPPEPPGALDLEAEPSSWRIPSGRSDPEARWALEEKEGFDAQWAWDDGASSSDPAPARPAVQRTAPPSISGAARCATPATRFGAAVVGAAVVSGRLASDCPSEALLIVDLREMRVTYRGHVIPTKPPCHLQPQALLALAVLASRPGEVVSVPELAAGMIALGGVRFRQRMPEAKDVRYRILLPFKKALAGRVEAGEIERLVQTVRGSGLRLGLCRGNVLARTRAAV